MRILIIVSLFFISVQGAFAQKLQTPASKEQIKLSFAPLVQKASPAVVNIYTKTKVRQRSFSPFMNDPFFRRFFDQGFAFGQPRERVESSLGSGVIVHEEGFVVTSHHVIHNADSIKVVLNDKREIDAKIVIRDKQTDLALLKLQSKEQFSYLELMNSDDLLVGDLVLAIGNPFGVGQTVTSGIVSAVARTTMGVSDYQFFIQTDAAINPGNSGGALINMDGKLAGVNTAIYSKSGGSNGIGFAVPSNMVSTLLQQKRKNQRVIRPWFGVEMQEVTQEIANSLGLQKPMGALVKKIHPKSPAGLAGLNVGDVVLRVDDTDIRDERMLQYKIATYPLDEKVDVLVLSNGKEKRLFVQMLAAPEIPKRDEQVLKGGHFLNQVKVANLSPAVAEELGISFFSTGVVVMDTSGGRFGVRRHDIISQINNTKIEDVAQLSRVLQKVKAPVRVILRRGNKSITMVVHR